MHLNTAIKLHVSIENNEDFSGGPGVKISHVPCKGHELDPWSGEIPHAHVEAQRKKSRSFKEFSPDLFFLQF